MALVKLRGSKPAFASSDPFATDSNPVMKYGTICSTRKIDSHGPRAPGCENSGCMFAVDPLANPSTVKIANVASSPNVMTFGLDRKSTRLNSSHDQISYAV